MIELVVVMAVLGLLLSIAVPRYLESLDRGKENVLAHNLAQMREAIDRYYGDRGAYPDQLEDLVERRYLRAVPLNPFTDSADWRTVSPPSGLKGRVYDVVDPGTARQPRSPAAAPEPLSDTPGTQP
jgi:general secretion pathway protein G